MNSYVSPAENFFGVISQTFRLLKQDGGSGHFSYLDQTYFTLEIVENINGISGKVYEHIVHLRSIWVPPTSRKEGWMVATLELLVAYADGCGVAIECVSNPFELSKDGKTVEENETIFLESKGFRYVVVHKDKQLRQRKRLRSLGFQNLKMKNIGNRDRIKKKDCWIYLPEKFDKQLLRQIYKTDW